MPAKQQTIARSSGRHLTRSEAKAAAKHVSSTPPARSNSGSQPLSSGKARANCFSALVGLRETDCAYRAWLRVQEYIFLLTLYAQQIHVCKIHTCKQNVASQGALTHRFIHCQVCSIGQRLKDRLHHSCRHDVVGHQLQSANAMKPHVEPIVMCNAKPTSTPEAKLKFDPHNQFDGKSPSTVRKLANTVLGMGHQKASLHPHPVVFCQLGSCCDLWQRRVQG